MCVSHILNFGALKWRLPRIFFMFSFLLLAESVNAQMWTDYATVSATGGLASNRLCYSDGRDLACDATAPYLTPSGRVGIGLTTPSFPLDVAGGAQFRGVASAGAAFTILPDATSGANGTVLESSFATGGYGPTIFKNGGVESMRIAGNGNVGVGTANPSGVFSAERSQNAATYIQVSNSDPGANAYATYVASNGSQSAEFGVKGTGAAAYGMLTAGTTYMYGNAPAGVGIMANNASGVIKFATGGNSEKMRIDASGNVGIGTSSPNYPLTLLSNWSIVGLNTNSTGQDAGIQLLSAGIRKWHFYNNASDSHNLYISRDASNTTGNIILQPYSGNVGIGLVSPTAKLEVAGTISATNLVLSGGCTGCGVGSGGSPGTPNTAVQYNNGGAFAGSSLYYISGTSKFTISGSLGIGVSPAGIPLEIYRPTFAYTRISAGDSTEAALLTSTTTGYFGAGTYGGNYQIVDYKRSATPLTISSNGNVGIGIWPPQVALDVSGAVSLRVPSTDYGYGLQLYMQDGAHNWTSTLAGLNIAFNTGNNTARTERMLIASNGNVGIGTSSPQVPLEVAGSISASRIVLRGVTTLDSDGQSSYLQAASNGYIYFYPNNHLTHVMTANGAVGINTINPIDMLTVMGGATTISSSVTNDGVLRLTSIGGASYIESGLKAASGSAAPIVFTDMYANKEWMRIAANGNVGIGTGSPGSSLEISSSGFYPLILNNAPATGGIGIQWNRGGSPNWYSYVGASGDTFNILSANGAAKLTLNSNTGNVGVGTQIPNAKLEVAGTISATNLVLSGSCTGCGGSAGIATYAMPSIGASPGWIKLGTFTAAQGGYHLMIKVVTSAGHNADPTQQSEVTIHFKTSNGVSVDANGFAGESTFYITNGTGGANAYNVKVKGNASGTSATSYDIYFYQAYNYNGGGSFYTVEYPSTATWSNSATTASDPGAASATVGVGIQRQIMLSNVGIGMVPTAALSVSGVAGVFNGSYYTQLGYNQLSTGGGQPLHLNYANNQNVLMFAGGTGNLGIGEGSPSERLSIGGNPSMFLQGNSSNWGYKINVKDFGGGDVPLRFIRRNAGTDIEMMRLNQTGDLVFSANNPALTSGGSYFTIPYGAYFSGGTVYVANNAYFRGGLSNDTGTYLQINGGTSNHTYINGNLGLATSAPATRLAIANGEIGIGQQNDATTYYRMGMDSGYTQYWANNAYWDGSAYKYVSTGGYGGLASRIFAASGVIGIETASGGTNPIAWQSRIYVANNGNVGIGNNNPAYKLDVGGAINATNLILSGGCTGCGGDNLGNHTATNNLNLATYGITGSAGTVIDPNGGWIRTYGSTGWYNNTYQGGWYMTDSTWLRAYNSKSIYTPSNMQADGNIAAGTFSGNGANITALNAGNLSAGAVPTARLGSGTANGTSYLRGDSTWSTITAGSTGQIQFNNGSNALAADSNLYWNNSSKKLNIGNLVDSAFSTPEVLDVNGFVNAMGYRTRQGKNGTRGTAYNLFNVDWTGSCVALYIDVTSQGCVYFTSDRRLKQAIEPIAKQALPLIMKLRPVSFRWKTQGIYKDDGINHLGFIADELQKIIPSAVRGKANAKDKDGNDAYQSIQQNEITPVLVKAIQELKADNDNLRAEILDIRRQLKARDNHSR